MFSFLVCDSFDCAIAASDIQSTWWRILVQFNTWVFQRTHYCKLLLTLRLVSSWLHVHHAWFLTKSSRCRSLPLLFITSVPSYCRPPPSYVQRYLILFHVTCCLWSLLGSRRLFCEADTWPERECCLLNSHDSIPTETLLGKSSVKSFTVYPNLKHISRDRSECRNCHQTAPECLFVICIFLILSPCFYRIRLYLVVIKEIWSNRHPLVAVGTTKCILWNLETSTTLLSKTR